MSAAPKESQVHGMTAALPADLSNTLQAALADWTKNGKVQRLWKKDASLWTGTDEAQWFGWLSIVEEQLAQVELFRGLASEVRAEKFSHALLLGMGGSSLCPEVMKMTFGKMDGFPEMFVLDSTDPAQVLSTEKKVDLAHTIFIVSSKSGTTLEPNIYHQYFYERAKQAVGAAEAPKRFIAITDPGSQLETVAKKEGFRRIFHGVPSIGGRYSALSHFGMAPAAVQGIDVPRFLKSAADMVRACGADVPAETNPGVKLGVILGMLAAHGRDKITLIASPGIHDLGAWLEQLLAESTGKQGKGLIPVDRETPGPAKDYGKDRVFVYVRLNSASDIGQDEAVEALEASGQPVILIEVNEIYDLGQEFFRWEIATAVAGSMIGIDAFNQPDVEASKIETRKLTSEYEKTGSLPAEMPFYVGSASEAVVKLFADSRNSLELTGAAGGKSSLVDYLRAHLSRLRAGDYFALLGFIQMNEEHEAALQAMRHAVRDTKRVATCLGFGPRFLHSTGQAYKGGPNTGVFLQLTCDDAKDVAIPGQKFTFGVVKAAQARGDFAVLAERGRRALRVHLGEDVNAGLRTLASALKEALQ
jgi:transaldolase/glucose-6-phosphate isomerase